MGKYDSSATRVRPIFGELLERDSTGASWLGAVLACSPQRNRLSERVLREAGALVEDGKPRFEYPAPPSDAFLRWLILHPAGLNWPRKHGVEVTFEDPQTQKRREQLLGRRGATEQRSAQEEALGALDRLGADGSRGRWWAFEGFTKVDICLQTERLVMFVEGKRKDVLSPSTEWFTRRNQLMRNLEVVGAVAGGRACGVILASEEKLPELDAQTLEASTPHLSGAEREVVAGRYLGQIRWEDLCGAVGVDFSALPDTI